MIWIKNEAGGIVDSVLSKELINKQTYVRVSCNSLHRVVPDYMLESDAPKTLKAMIAKSPVVETPKNEWEAIEKYAWKDKSGNVIRRYCLKQKFFYCLHDRFGRSIDLEAKCGRSAKLEADLHILLKAPPVKTQCPNVKAKQIIFELLEMLSEWDTIGDGRSGFGGFFAVNEAERFLDMPLSSVS